MAETTGPEQGGERSELVLAIRRQLAGGRDLSRAVPGILQTVCEQLKWDVGVLSLIDPHSKLMRRAGAWQRPGTPAELTLEDQGARAAAAAAAGFFGTVSHPIGGGAQGVLGLVELYRRDVVPGDADVLRALEAVVAEIARFLQQEEDEHEEVAMPGDPDGYRALVEGIPLVSYVVDLDDALTVRYVSPQLKTLAGVSPNRWMAEPDARTRSLHPDDRARVVSAYRRAREDGQPFTIQYRLVSKAGRAVWVRDEGRVARDPDGRPVRVHGVLAEVPPEQVGRGETASAKHDDLTGLPSRELFQGFVEEVLERARRHDGVVTVLAVDIDDFGPLNQTLGQDVGDELLRQFAERLRQGARETELVARGRADEFLLLLSGRPMGEGRSKRERASDALLAAEVEASRIHEALQTPFTLSGSEFYVTANIGISSFPVDAADAATMLRHATSATDRGKKSGPGGYILYEAEAADPVRGLAFATRLRNAVERRQWVLHYHPIVELESGGMVGVEALLRWRDPSGRLVAPGEFLLAAEDMGLIGAIGDWVLEEICRQSRLWKDQGIELDTSINFSARQLWQPDVVQMVANHLQATGIDPGTLVVEITEAAAVTDPDRTLRVLREFRDAGLRLAIDDFGTSTSSLARLKELPVDIIKVDRSFVRNLPEDVQAARMARAIISLGHSLDMVPLAEAIDSEAQREFLRRAGCPLGQGYLFAKPMPAEAITERCLTESSTGDDVVSAPQAPRLVPVGGFPRDTVEVATAAAADPPSTGDAGKAGEDGEPGEAVVGGEVEEAGEAGEAAETPTEAAPVEPAAVQEALPAEEDRVHPRDEETAAEETPGQESAVQDGPASPVDGDLAVIVEGPPPEPAPASEPTAVPAWASAHEDGDLGEESAAPEPADEGPAREEEAAPTPPGPRDPELQFMASQLLRELASDEDPTEGERAPRIAPEPREAVGGSGWRPWQRRGDGERR